MVKCAVVLVRFWLLGIAMLLYYGHTLTYNPCFSRL